MAREYSDYQKKVISDYYKNLDTIMLQKLQELTTELFLAQNTPKEDRLWERVEAAMEKLNVPPEHIEHIMRKRSVKVLSMNLQDWLKSSSSTRR